MAFTITGWERQVFVIPSTGHRYVQICTAVDGGGNLAAVYRTAYACGLDTGKTPPRPAHQLAMRSVDAKNPEGIGLPTFVPHDGGGPGEALPYTQPAAEDRRQFAAAADGAVFASLFWHNPQSMHGDGGPAPVAAAAGVKPSHQLCPHRGFAPAFAPASTPAWCASS